MEPGNRFTACVVHLWSLIKSKHVVLHKETIACGHQLEHLAELEWSFFVLYHEMAHHKNQDSSARGRLDVHLDDAMFALLEGQCHELLPDGLLSLKLLSLKRHHRRILVQSRQPLSVRVERRVIVVDELLHFSTSAPSLVSVALFLHNGTPSSCKGP